MKSVTFSCIRVYGMTTKNVRHTNYIGTSISKYMSSTRGWCDGSDMSDRATTTLLHQHNESRQSHWRPSSATHRNRRTSYNFTIVTRSLKCHCLKPNLWWTSTRWANCVQHSLVCSGYQVTHNEYQIMAAVQLAPRPTSGSLRQSCSCQVQLLIGCNIMNFVLNEAESFVSHKPF